MRTGVIGKKLGMTRLSTKTAAIVPVTVLSSRAARSSRRAPRSKDGYVALQLGAARAKAKNTSKPMRGHFAKAEGRAQAHARRVPRQPRTT